MIRLNVPLDREERQALIKLADTERRDPRLQAALIIRRELERLGLVAAKTLPQAESEATNDDTRA